MNKQEISNDSGAVEHNESELERAERVWKYAYELFVDHSSPRLILEVAKLIFEQGTVEAIQEALDNKKYDPLTEELLKRTQNLFKARGNK